MYDYTAPQFGATATTRANADRPAILCTVLALLGFASVFAAAGALIARLLGPSAFVISTVGSFATLIALYAARDRAPLVLLL